MKISQGGGIVLCVLVADADVAVKIVREHNKTIKWWEQRWLHEQNRSDELVAKLGDGR